MTPNDFWIFHQQGSPNSEQRAWAIRSFDLMDPALVTDHNLRYSFWCITYTFFQNHFCDFERSSSVFWVKNFDTWMRSLIDFAWVIFGSFVCGNCKWTQRNLWIMKMIFWWFKIEPNHFSIFGQPQNQTSDHLVISHNL